MKLKLTYIRSTKNKDIYGCEDENAPIQAVYIAKNTAFEGVPPVITVTIEVNDDDN